MKSHCLIAILLAASFLGGWVMIACAGLLLFPVAGSCSELGHVACLLVKQPPCAARHGQRKLEQRAIFLMLRSLRD